MARKCAVSGKTRQVGFSVSHANNKRKKTWLSNLHKKRLFDPEQGKWVRVRISSRALKAIDKRGVSAVLREQGLS